jgi:dihydroneopterin aldolase
VLDYRKIRQIIIDECTAQHVNLLESLIGKLAARLMQLPGVVGVRVKIAKLEIFDDCEVAIRAEAGAMVTRELGADSEFGQPKEIGL